MGGKRRQKEKQERKGQKQENEGGERALASSLRDGDTNHNVGRGQDAADQGPGGAVDELSNRVLLLGPSPCEHRDLQTDLMKYLVPAMPFKRMLGIF